MISVDPQLSLRTEGIAGRNAEGECCGVKSLIFGAMIWRGDETGIRSFWQYPTLGGALIAYSQWDGTGDPPDGWERATGPGDNYRRRLHGNPATEYLAP